MMILDNDPGLLGRRSAAHSQPAAVGPTGPIGSTRTCRDTPTDRSDRERRGVGTGQRPARRLGPSLGRATGMMYRGGACPAPKEPLTRLGDALYEAGAFVVRLPRRALGKA